MKTRQDVFDWLSGQLRFGIKPGLERMSWMIEQLGLEERRSIHVAGTNGKGSTVAFLRAMAMENGLSVGTFTSPYIIQFEERIMLNGEPIPEDALVDVANRVKTCADKAPETLTEFELLTMMAWCYFDDTRPDLIIWEVGLGGRLDSTNVLKQPLATIVTSIGHDHQGILGDTLEEIALEKYGIMKRGVPMFHSIEKKSLIELLHQRGDDVGSSIQDVRPIVKKIVDGAETVVTYEDTPSVVLGLTGHHQAYNGACAVAVARHLGWSDDAIRRGLERARHPGRYELVSKRPRIILDGAHNPEGIEALVLQAKYETDVAVLTAILEDKDRDKMIHALQEIGDVYETTFDFPRARTKAQLEKDGARFVEWKAWLQNWVESPTSETLIVTGSLYFISEVRRFLS
ncbi:bifunctional folylpolyglutamate synthase/dihydrofolate synthase [Exiguobacterium profundum]|uniref:bifunctional folylpolyglutamate synthase/dihydrofolate synthase n=1 Tax=Exiguobacterium TaxID=33986 RepID=UPI001BFC6B2B|nr:MULTISPECIES: folylpolyglutamate synthase/dihydrofolate synthase family protein [Exiguobacterium]MCT4797291.1 bifunctional folylpolyglutamate synthase/dihydrofolate synthase [Exiguobacterium profundum]